MCLSWIDTPWSRYTFCTSLHEVLLGLADALDLEQLLRVAGTVDDRIAGGDLLALGDLQAGQARDGVGVLAAVVAHDGDDAALALVVGEPDHTGGAGQGGLALGRPSLEELDHAGQTAGDVGAGDAAGVEGPHGELRAGLADGLGGDHADRLAELDVLAGGQRAAVAGRAHAEVALAGEHGAHPHAVDLGIVAEGVEVLLADLVAGLEHGAVRELHVDGQGAAEDAGLEVAALAGGVGHDALHPEAADGVALALAVGLADDQLLRHVDEATGEVAGVGGAERGVDEALASTRRGDEVLEHREPLAEVALDGSRDHVASGVGHQAAHAGDLADLHHVPSGTGAHHHVDGVELLGGETPLHRLPHLVGGVGPDLHLLLAPLTVGDDALPELLLDLVGFLLVVVEDPPLLGGRRDVVDRDGEAGPGREAEAQVLDAVEAGGHLGLGVVVGQPVDDLAHLLLLHRLGDVAEAGGQALVEQEPAEGALAAGGRRSSSPSLRVAVGSRRLILACSEMSPAS